ncbi:MAG: YibE/F family protein [Spirochaetales bacterium]|uniref:YibE/F family protein n=1 Tax=Candidatus Thalassospirochaeta sargassi TaxID=3119039 RepID=A0AAJ1IGJ3_9SPIO|nr:YibE/F family protein [Spirochaetales bacterium]
MLIAEKNTHNDIFFTLIVCVLTIGVLFVPTGFEDRQKTNITRARGRITAVDNTDLEQYGIVKTGNQGVTMEILNGKFKGLVTDSNNMLIGKLELDKMFAVGDVALVTIDMDENGEFVYANPVDHFRIRTELFLLILFAGLLLLYAGWTGAKALLSFMFTGVAIWKLLLPGFLNGYNPILLSLGIVMMMSAVIIFLVGGMSKKGIISFLGTLAGIGFTAILSILFGNLFKVHGAVKPFSESLLYSGYAHLDLSAIFTAGIFLASSGAVMDISMDIAASMHEIKHKRPDIHARELIISGIKVGRAVVGTMTTTLLLAYSGSYTAVLMVMMAQGTPAANILNLTYVSAEILHTLVGSFGLVLTAPFTALIGGFIYNQSGE